MTESAELLESPARTDATAETGTPPAAAATTRTGWLRRGKRVGEATISLKTLVAAGCVVLTVAVIAVLGWRVYDVSAELDSLRAGAADNAHAEKVALDYATGAAEMNFQDLAAWRTRLTTGTSPALTGRLTQAATSMEQIIVPLQWVSTAQPVAAKVRSADNGVYSVDCFVSILTKNSQAPEGIQSTATYQLSLDSRNDWAVTEIGGVGAALEPSGTPR
ncbi:hypothetical protein [Nocardia carnea]|uniref:hypothetical protein n=1 Tax=Nocardia carnea TaxID=37328 RepID=UPI0024572705|nr:hypothetical protein [Nocardia carnea]